ncbi:MAG: hypothetical protein ACOC8B_02450 [Gemmatimonadota bacterium]
MRIDGEGRVYVSAIEWTPGDDGDGDSVSRLVGRAGGPRLEEAFTAQLRPLYLPLLAVDLSEPVGPRAHVAEHRDLVQPIGRAAIAPAMRLIDQQLDSAESAVRRGTPDGAGP